ncbi:hypothetical protein CCR91_16685 [Thiorhodovibrio winogradskyi]|nr:hypothetical protein [Thiorhodovibrio winogradskyi]
MSATENSQVCQVALAAIRNKRASAARILRPMFPIGNLGMTFVPIILLADQGHMLIPLRAIKPAAWNFLIKARARVMLSYSGRSRFGLLTQPKSPHV